MRKIILQEKKKSNKHATHKPDIQHYTHFYKLDKYEMLVMLTRCLTVRRKS